MQVKVTNELVLELDNLLYDFSNIDLPESYTFAPVITQKVIFLKNVGFKAIYLDFSEVEGLIGELQELKHVLNSTYAEGQQEVTDAE